MVFEIVQYDVKSGMEDSFGVAFQPALELLRSADGCESAQLLRSIEHPNTFRLLVHWQTLEHHTERFRGTPAHTQLKAISSQFVERSSGAEHHRDAVPTS
jgi:heme-degrading monooxygenase HmoA